MNKNNISYRLFPRYDISKLPFSAGLSSAEFPLLKNIGVKLLDVSVSGFRLESPENLKISNNAVDVLIQSENFTFELQAIDVWSADYPDGKYHYGFHFEFTDINAFNGWLGMIKAMHQLSLKSPYDFPNPADRD